MLGSNLRAMLDRCVELMVTGAEDRQLNFLAVHSQLDGCRLECVAYLAAGLECYTENRLTVRAISGAAITGNLKGLGNLYLAVCPFSTISGRITALTDEMMLYVISPNNGIGCARM